MAQGRDLTKLYSNAEETVSPEEVTVEGKVPSYVHGTYLKVGPGKYHFDTGFSMNHYLDGYSTVAQFEIVNGEKVKYQNKYLSTDVFQRANAAQKPVVCEFGTGAQPDPKKGWFARCIPQVIPEMSDNHNMMLYKIGTNLCVAGESCFFRDIDEISLQLGEKHDTNKCYGLNFVSPHLLTDTDGTIYTVGSSFLTGLKYNFVKIPAMSGKPTTKEILKKSQVIASISSQVTTLLSMHHSFGMTNRYLVFIEQPFVLNVTKILGGVLSKGQSFMDWMEWRGELRNKFYLIDKQTGKVVNSDAVTVTDEPFMFTHLINCYEQGDTVVCDLLRYDNGDFFEGNYLRNLLSNGPARDTNYARAERFVIPVLGNVTQVPENKELISLPETSASAVRVGKKIVVKPEALTKKGLELPCLNKAFLGRKYQYFYCTGNTSPEGYFENTLVKMDLDKKMLSQWHGSPHCFPGEPIFIPNPDANENDEDNGIVMSVVVNSRKGNSDYLVFLDAKTFREIGRANFSQNIPLLVHGLYLPK